MWNRLPSCSLLSSRGIPIAASCPLCGEEEETIDHAILECLCWRRIWLRIGYICGNEGSGNLCSRLLEDIRSATRHRSTLWAITAYQIWLARNQIIFADATISTLGLERKIRSMVAESASFVKGFDYCNPGHWGSPAAPAANRHTVFISWEPPPPGFVKINFDGSVRGRLAGSAFVIRGSDGALLSAGGFASLDSSVPLAELHAAWAGITQAVRRLQAHSFLIEGDSLIVIRWLQSAYVDHTPSNPILSEIRGVLLRTHRVHIRHIFREANSVADWVATSVSFHVGAWYWNHDDPCPSVLKQILYSDSSGLTRTRIV